MKKRKLVPKEMIEARDDSKWYVSRKLNPKTADETFDKLMERLKKK